MGGSALRVYEASMDMWWDGRGQRTEDRGQKNGRSAWLGAARGVSGGNAAR